MAEPQGIFRWRGENEKAKDGEQRKKAVRKLAEKNDVSSAEIIRNAIDLFLLNQKR
jgi:hypothetical protein